MLTKREEYIKTIFRPFQKRKDADYISEEEVDKIVKKISSIGNSIGFIGQNISLDDGKTEKRKHKYDVWIAKEVKKDLNVLDMSIDLRLIIDWAVETKANLFEYDFYDANTEQAQWHQNMLVKHNIEDIPIHELDSNRVVFRFSDKNHFLYILNVNDLKYEGNTMGHCVGGGNYSARVKNKLSLILSLRDSKNEPHVTIEIDTKTKKVVQQHGKGNQVPTQKYSNLIKEFVLFSSNYKGLENYDTLKFLNMHLL